MFLSREEKEMLDGKMGSGTAFSMNLLTKVGDAMGAEKMIKPVSSHVVSLSFSFYGPLADCRYLEEEMVEGLSAFRVPTTTNVKLWDIDDEKLNKRFGIGDSTIDKLRKSMTHKKFEKLGAIPTYTCTPFFVYQTRMGESLAGAESVAIVMYNSIFGARLNRETAPTALASAVTGRTPEFGMHKTENRYAQLQVDISEELKTEEFSSSDYSALGYYVGKLAVDKNVVFTNLPKDISISNLKNVLAPLGVSGAVMLAHIVGVTPEAPSLDAALQGRKPERRIVVGKKELENIYGLLNTSTEEKADLTVLGCPHAPIAELIEIAEFLNGKRIREDAFLLIATPAPVKLLADRMGIAKIVEKTGGLIVSDMCPHEAFWDANGKEFVAEMGSSIKTVATNSAKAAHYLSAQGRNVKFGNVKECISAIM